MSTKKVAEQYYAPPPKLGKWEGFKQFLWNSETSQCLGRTGSSWGKYHLKSLHAPPTKISAISGLGTDKTVQYWEWCKKNCMGKPRKKLAAILIFAAASPRFPFPFSCCPHCFPIVNMYKGEKFCLHTPTVGKIDLCRVGKKHTITQTHTYHQSFILGIFTVCRCMCGLSMLFREYGNIT